ncbi:MAG: hypothetical protein IT306_06730 [Chloroflexi bacterium]|nr:hypothetical protein [Chloroflexota bacterium]
MQAGPGGDGQPTHPQAAPSPSATPAPSAPPHAGIRSPMLASLPQPPTLGRRQRIVRRATVAGGVGGALLLVVGIVLGRLVPREGALGQALYGLHDGVFLPIKGHAYTAFLPTSLIWWGFAALLLALLLASWLSDRSFVRRPHAVMARWIVGWPLLDGVLVRSVGVLRRRGLACELLLRVADHERKQAVRRLLTHPNAGGIACRRAIRLTLLTIRLTMLSPFAPGPLKPHLDDFDRAGDAYGLPLSRARERGAGGEGRSVVPSLLPLQVAAIWLRGLLAVRIQRQDALAGPLLDVAPLLLDGLRSAQAGADAAPSDTGFTLAAFARDLDLLTEIERRLARAAQSAEARGDRARALAEAIPLSRLRALAVAVDARRDLLERVRGIVEVRRFGARGGGSGGGSSLPLPFGASIPPEQLALAGQLHLDLALLVADLGQAPALAEASLEAVEALALSLDLYAALSGSSDLEPRLSGLVAGLPNAEQYAVCARIAAADPHGRLEGWAGRASPNGVVHPDDLALARQRQTAMQLAGGPDA